MDGLPPIRSPAGPIVDGPLRSLGLAVVLVPFTSFIRLLALTTDLLPVVLLPTEEALPRTDLCFILALPFGFAVDVVLLGLVRALVRLTVGFLASVFLTLGFFKDLASFDTGFLTVGFLTVGFLASGFLASGFLTVGGLPLVLLTLVLASGFLASGFLAVGGLPLVLLTLVLAFSAV